jgi:hypothetical protein
MSVRYDESLPTLIRVARSFGVDLSGDGVIILRDSAGRLGIAFASRRKLDGLAASLREALGAYALAEPILPSAIFQTMNVAHSRDIAVSIGGGEFCWIRLVDRRIVGADWLSDLAPPAVGPSRLVFGSLKGGVGRTTALAVFAADLVGNGKRVLCVDLDLEAPGLGSMLLRANEDDDRRPKYGALDYLVESAIDGIKDDELFDFIGVSHFSDGGIHVLPSVGRVTDNHPENMIGKLGRGLIEDVSPEGRISVATKMRRMVDRFVGYGDYDAVLIDARAGLAEITAGAWLGLGARKLLLFGTNQQQTFQGYRYVLSHLAQTLGVPDSASDDDWRLRLAFAQGKAPSAPDDRSRFRERLHELCAETIYDAEDDAGVEWPFNFPFDEVGADVPHDHTYVVYHPDYDAFAPLEQENVLQSDVYRGPFGAFLQRAWLLLGWERPA